MWPLDITSPIQAWLVVSRVASQQWLWPNPFALSIFRAPFLSRADRRRAPDMAKRFEIQVHKQTKCQRSELWSRSSWNQDRMNMRGVYENRTHVQGGPVQSGFQWTGHHISQATSLGPLVNSIAKSGRLETYLNWPSQTLINLCLLRHCLLVAP